MTLIKKFATFLLLFLMAEMNFGQCVDLSLEPSTKGKDVTDVVIKKVRSSGIFKKDNDFLERLAYIETKYGNNLSTYSDFSGDIWNVDKNMLFQTQDIMTHPWLHMIHGLIAQKFGINWSAVTSVDLLKPLYSGLAAMIFVETKIEQSIPPTIKEQAEFWKKYYHKTGTGTADTFIAEIKQMQNNFRCGTPTDWCNVLDGSGSISPDSFTKAKESIYVMINIMYSKAGRYCLIVYDHNVKTYFSLDNTLTKSDMLSTIENLYQPRGCTNTKDAISEAVRIFDSVSQRPEVARYIWVYTDGYSNGPDCGTPGVQPGPKNAEARGITMCAYGIGTDTSKDELDEISNFGYCRANLVNYEHFLDSAYSISREICSTALTLPINTEMEDSLFQHEKRFYNFKVSSAGISVTIRQTSGRSIAYYSYNETTPSSALHDGQFSGFIFIPSSVSQVFIAVEGLETQNSYSIYTEYGNSNKNKKF